MTNFKYEGPGFYLTRREDRRVAIVGITANEKILVGVTQYQTICAFDVHTGKSLPGIPDEWSLTGKYIEPPKREPVAVVWDKRGRFDSLYSESSDGSQWLFRAKELATGLWGTLQIINPDDAPLPEDSE